MKVEFLKSFEKSLKKLHSKSKNNVIEACVKLIGFIEESSAGNKGLGLKRLQINFWEIRVGIKLRVIFRWENDHIQFILVGSHDNIKKFLKENN